MARKSTIASIVKKLDEEINHKYAEYIDLHKELNKHCGKKLEDPDLPEVNRLITSIQDTFADIYPVLHFIAYRYQFVTNAQKDYEEFIKRIVAAGATEDKIKGT